ncbi:MAG TPA: hypothetical protein VLM79_38410 [Kofleriaceae bacterium]|nr:hypothetical protein [Kofleriaceae bacterium]
MRTFERAYLRQALVAAGDNVTAAARIAGIDRIYFYRLLWKYGLRRGPDPREHRALLFTVLRIGAQRGIWLQTRKLAESSDCRAGSAEVSR